MQNDLSINNRAAGMRRMRKGALLRGGAVVAVLSAAAIPALAQVEEGGSARLEEIVVTAQKRSEPLQRTALAISALSASTLEARGIESAGKLTGVAPNLTTTSGNGNSSHL
ncbi:MAG TPA: TonB-dependent receptor, partial [Pedomonas sp.]|nr:TonB-dependent receptor [Pedomonas sp.]